MKVVPLTSFGWVLLLCLSSPNYSRTFTPTSTSPPLMAVAEAHPRIARSGEVVLLDAGNSSGVWIDDYAWRQAGDGPRVTLHGVKTVSATFEAPSVSTVTTLTSELRVLGLGGESTSVQAAYGQVEVVILTPVGSPDLHSLDLALSGYIDMMDLLHLSENWQAATSPQHGDFNRDGKVGAEDLAEFLGGWHQSVPPITIPIPGLPEDARPMRLVLIRGGSFQMGSPDTERGRFLDYEGPVHTVNFSYDFYIGETEVTQAQWAAIVPNGHPTSRFGVGNDFPVYNVSWNDITSEGGFLDLLVVKAKTEGFRLPTEAEWEYACRAGTQSRFSFGDNLSCDDDCGNCPLADQHMWWCGNNNPNESKPVGSKLPNAFGLYDMHGNVWEWCQDWWHYGYDGAPTDGIAWVEPTPGIRVIRGGVWFESAWGCRSAMRYASGPSDRSSGVGFRVVLPVSR